MASSTDEALQTIQQSYNDILIQATKHMKVIAKDGPGALTGTHSGIREKSTDALSRYHLALNQIESEIIQAKSVLLRDLNNLRAARAPAPASFIPTPVPAPQLAAPMAPMMELPSAAAHSRSLNPPIPAVAAAGPPPSSKEVKTVAPFPDMGMGMGMGMSPDVVDLTSGDKKPSPRVSANSIKLAGRNAQPTNVKPSPKQIHKPTPPAKVTPVPPPQIPRLQSLHSTKPQPAPPPPKATPQPAQPVQPIQAPQQTQAAKTTQDNAMNGLMARQAKGTAEGASASTGNGELNFTDMEFSLAPPPGEQQGAPLAPMPEFDLATFAPQNGNADATAGNAAGSNAPQPPNGRPNDDLFNLGDSNVNLGDNTGGDNMFDLGGADAHDSTFDDMIFFGTNDTDMAQFDDAYFGL
ncbi:hypothetical protein F4777DRAFT_315760 [Nemania sp. FL0916]|nr:hypothetical protein F4777DRAFT_315760 [Nemania sp. FL0916]